jgi:hypothetical protein
MKRADPYPNRSVRDAGEACREFACFFKVDGIWDRAP